MTARSHVVRAARIALLPISLAVAAAAFVHAGSETEAFSIGPGASSRLGLDANIAAVLVDGGFRAEMVSRQAQAPNEFPRLPDPLIALARDSFAANPLEVSSLRTIALGNMLQHDEERARRVMRLASQISKRDTITNLWLAQDYGRAGDVEAMLASFDHALRTSARAREFVMKPVVNALASDESYAQLGKLLAGRPEWEVDFWREFANNPVATANAAEFLAGSGIPLDRIPEQNRELLYSNLKRSHQYDTLYGLAALDAGAKEGSAALAAGRFVTADGSNPLGWVLRSQGSFAARVHEKTGELQIDARAGSFGLAASRIVRVRGNYRLSVTMAEAVPEQAHVELAVNCTGDAGGELSRLILRSGEKNGELTFSSGKCEFASLQLSFTADPGRRDVLIRLADITLRPA